MKHNRRIVIVGATSSIAKSCARIWVTEADLELLLVGRDLTRLENISNDLKVRNEKTKITCFAIDFLDIENIENLAVKIFENKPVDLIFLSHGYLPNQKTCQENLNEFKVTMDINGLSTIMIAEAFASHLIKQKTGTLAFVSSVAGDRARKSNYVYGASKSLVNFYAEGLQHRLAKSGVLISIIKPGPTDTPMTAHLKRQGTNLADVVDVATTITKGLKRNKSIIYAPTYWALIMFIVKRLPLNIFKHLNI